MYYLNVVILSLILPDLACVLTAEQWQSTPQFFYAPSYYSWINKAAYVLSGQSQCLFVVNTLILTQSSIAFLKSLQAHRRTLKTEIILRTNGPQYLHLHQLGKLVMLFWQTDHILSSLAFTRFLLKGIYKERKEQEDSLSFMKKNSSILFFKTFTHLQR